MIEEQKTWGAQVYKPTVEISAACEYSTALGRLVIELITVLVFNGDVY